MALGDETPIQLGQRRPASAGREEADLGVDYAHHILEPVAAVGHVQQVLRRGQVGEVEVGSIQWPVAILTMLLLFARVQAKFRKNKDMKQRAKLELNSLKIENDRKAVEVEILRRELDGFEANIKDNQARQEDEEPGK